MKERNTSKLSDLRLGEKAVIKEILLEGMSRRRLLDFGFVCDSEVVAAFRSPLGDPTSFQIKGSLIAIRREESDKILVEKIS
jgi:Fe2+ transport system protein FeoA